MEDLDADLAAALDAARNHPGDVHVRIAAAQACDAAGDARAAAAHYDAAWALGVPDGDRLEVLVGYGAVLRAVGRLDEAIALLGEAVAEHGDYAPLKIMLGMALQSAGHGTVAMATMLDVILDLSRDGDALDGYERVLTRLHQELLDAAVSSTTTRP